MYVRVNKFFFNGTMHKYLNSINDNEAHEKDHCKVYNSNLIEIGWAGLNSLMITSICPTNKNI